MSLMRSKRHKNHNDTRINMHLIYLLLAITVFLLNLDACQCQETEATANVSTKQKVKIEDSPYYENIKNLSNNELEAICTDRGFEIVKEGQQKSENSEYTREDYMHAASQCLAIEAEMAKVIEEHPEILQDLKEETNQMNYQKALLEKELSDAQAQLNSLKKKENEDPTLFVNPNINSNDEGVNQEAQKDIAEEMNEKKVTPPPSDDSIDKEENKTTINSTPKITIEKDTDGTDIEVIDLDENSESIPEKEETVTETNESDSTTSDTTIESTSTSQEEEPLENVETIGITNINPANHTVTDIINEVNAQILRDIRLVINTLLPENVRTQLLEALQPFLKVGKESLNTALDIFLRYFNVMMSTVKEEVKNRQKKFVQPQKE